MTKPNKPKPFILPDWITGELLDAWVNYFKIRKKKKIVVTDYVKNNRVKQLVEFRKNGMDLVKIIDAASEANWHKFYPPKDFVRHKEKPVQLHKKVVDSPEVLEKREIYMKLCKNLGAYNAPLEIDRTAHRERVTKALNALNSAKANSSTQKLSTLIKKGKNGN